MSRSGVTTRTTSPRAIPVGTSADTDTARFPTGTRFESAPVGGAAATVARACSSIRTVTSARSSSVCNRSANRSSSSASGRSAGNVQSPSRIDRRVSVGSGGYPSMSFTSPVTSTETRPRPPTSSITSVERVRFRSCLSEIRFGTLAPSRSPCAWAYREIINTTMIAVRIAGARSDDRIVSSLRASSPPLIPAIASARTTTPSPGMVTSVTYLKTNPSTPATSAGTIPVMMPR